MSRKTDSSSNRSWRAFSWPYRVTTLLLISVIALLAILLVPVLGSSKETNAGSKYAIIDVSKLVVK